MNEIDDICHEDTQQHLSDTAAVDLENGPLADELAAERRAEGRGVRAEQPAGAFVGNPPRWSTHPWPSTEGHQVTADPFDWGIPTKAVRNGRSAS